MSVKSSTTLYTLVTDRPSSTALNFLYLATFASTVSTSEELTFRSLRKSRAWSAHSRHSVSLAIETFVSLATSSGGSLQQSRDNRHLALNGKGLGPFLDARRGAYASFEGALRHPSGLRPSSSSVTRKRKCCSLRS